MYIESWGEMGCNFLNLEIRPCRNHTNAYRGLRVALGYLARAGPDSISD